MAKVQSDSVYRIIDVVGVSETSWEDAGRKAVETSGRGYHLLACARVDRQHEHKAPLHYPTPSLRPG